MDSHQMNTQENHHEEEEQGDEPGVTHTSPSGPTSSTAETVSLAETTLPEYTQHADGGASRLPSYARATAGDRPKMTEEERLASLREFVKEREYSNDYYGGHKGQAVGPPNDPFKLFRWAKRKMNGEEGNVWGKMTEEEQKKWEEEGGEVDSSKGEAARGDIDTHRIA